MNNALSLLGLLMLVSGCVGTTATVQKSIWPAEKSAVWYYYVAQPLASPEEAVGTLKNLQQSFVEWDAGVDIASLDVDKFGLRAKWHWTKVAQQTRYVPSYGGFFAGWNYVPTYSGTYQTETFTSEKSDMLIIPFADIQRLVLLHMPLLPRRYQYGLLVRTAQKTVALRFDTEASLFRFANAVYTLASACGAKLERPRVGIEFTALTPEQRAAVNLTEGTGFLVINVASGSPAQKADIRFLDVLLEVNGQPLNTLADFVAASQAAAASADKKLQVKLLRREKVLVDVVDPVTQAVTGKAESEALVQHTTVVNLGD